MKPENLKENMKENMRELTLDELEKVSGGDTGKAVLTIAAGGLMSLLGSNTADIEQVVRNVAAKYQ